MKVSTATAALRQLAPALITAAVLGAAFSPGIARAGTPTADADVAYDTQHFAEALALYEQEAAAGDRRAQEIAGLMHLYGPGLYSEAVPRDLARAAQWLSLAAAQGSPMADRLLLRLQPLAQR